MGLLDEGDRSGQRNVLHLNQAEVEVAPEPATIMLLGLAGRAALGCRTRDWGTEYCIGIERTISLRLRFFPLRMEMR